MQDYNEVCQKALLLTQEIVLLRGQYDQKIEELGDAIRVACDKTDEGKRSPNHASAFKDAKQAWEYFMVVDAEFRNLVQQCTQKTNELNDAIKMAEVLYES